jgi:hypothetical protein
METSPQPLVRRFWMALALSVVVLMRLQNG